MPSVGFELTISAKERPQTYALDRAANGTGCKNGYPTKLNDTTLVTHWVFTSSEMPMPER